MYESKDFFYNFSDLASSYPPFAHQLDQLKIRRKNDEISKKQNCIESDSCFGTFVTFEFNVELARAILDKHHGGLTLPSMPKGYLCPTIPNRLNYVKWIKDLVYGDSIHEQKQKRISSDKLHFHGLDIGAGASCIYPLLLSSVLPSDGKQWKFFATEVDSLSFESAQTNVVANNLQNQIRVALVEQTPQNFTIDIKTMQGSPQKSENLMKGPVLTAILAASKSNFFSDSISNSLEFDFCMTNPPFYSTLAESTKPRAGDSRTRTSMTSSESFYPRGGECAFILDMIHDSLNLRQKITWYSSLIGKKCSLEKVERELVRLGFGRANVCIAEFVQGERGLQRRWGVAWTFMEVPVRFPSTELNSSPQSFLVSLRPEYDLNSTVSSKSKSKIPTAMPIESYRELLRRNVAQRIYEYCTFIEKDIDRKLQVTIENNALEQHTSFNAESRSCTLVTIVEDFSETHDISKTQNSSNVHGKDRLENYSFSFPEDQTVGKLEVQPSSAYAKSTDLEKGTNLSASKDICSVNDCDKQSGCVKDHFLIDILLQDSKQPEGINTHSDDIVVVTVRCFCHTQNGDIIVKKIMGRMKGEVQRSNRRWRRKMNHNST